MNQIILKIRYPLRIFEDLTRTIILGSKINVDSFVLLILNIKKRKRG
jgi:hypothetical protein